MPPENFREALTKLVNEKGYGGKLSSDPSGFVEEFGLTPGELGLILAVREMLGGRPEADGQAVDSARRTSSPESQH